MRLEPLATNDTFCIIAPSEAACALDRTGGFPHMPEYASYQELIDRDEANDLDAIMNVVNPYIGAEVTTVADGAEAMFTWDYEKGARPGLNKLYEKAKNS